MLNSESTHFHGLRGGQSDKISCSQHLHPSTRPNCGHTTLFVPVISHICLEFFGSPNSYFYNGTHISCMCKPFPPLASFACGDMAVGDLSSPFAFFFLFSSEGPAVESRGVFQAGFFSSSLLLFFSSSLLSSSYQMHSRSFLELVRLEFDLSSLGAGSYFNALHPIVVRRRCSSSRRKPASHDSTMHSLWNTARRPQWGLRLH
jgi:hypothetical protein